MIDPETAGQNIDVEVDELKSRLSLLEERNAILARQHSRFERKLLEVSNVALGDNLKERVESIESDLALLHRSNDRHGEDIRLLNEDSRRDCQCDPKLYPDDRKQSGVKSCDHCWESAEKAWLRVRPITCLLCGVKNPDQSEYAAYLSMRSRDRPAAVCRPIMPDKSEAGRRDGDDEKWADSNQESGEGGPEGREAQVGVGDSEGTFCECGPRALVANRALCTVCEKSPLRAEHGPIFDAKGRPRLQGKTKAEKIEGLKKYLTALGATVRDGRPTTHGPTLEVWIEG